MFNYQKFINIIKKYHLFIKIRDFNKLAIAKIEDTLGANGSN